MIDRAAIRARVAAATEGPWVHNKGAPIRTGSVHYNIETEREIVTDRGEINGQKVRPCRRMIAWLAGGMGERPPERTPDDPEILPDAQFIAHARTDVPALLEVVERLVVHALEAEWSGEVDMHAYCPCCRAYADVREGHGVRTATGHFPACAIDSDLTLAGLDTAEKRRTYGRRRT